MTQEFPENIDDLLAALDEDHLYKTEELIKQSDRERTEKVIGPEGDVYIRKYLRLEPGESQAYGKVAQLGSPFLPKIYKVQAFGDDLIVIMEYLEGDSLRRHAKIHGSFDTSTIRRFLQGVIDGVKALHTAPGGPIIHRDINPGNIMIAGGNARLIDFGIARTYRYSAPRDTHLWGTAGYAAPEQFGFGQSDVRADVYALGMLLRFLFTGCEPDEEGDGSMPPAVRSIIAKATAIDPDDRYCDVFRFEAALEKSFTAAGSRTVSDAYATPADQTRQTKHIFTLSEFRRYSPVGLTNRYRSIAVLWWIWRISVGFFGFIFFVAGVYLAISFIGRKPPTAFYAFSMSIFIFGAPSILLTDMFGITSRMTWFREHRYRKIASCLVVCFAFATVDAMIFKGMGIVG